MAYEDLLKDTSESKDDGNYFLVTITDLDLGTAYPLQFRWKNKNGTLGAWSSVKTFTSEYATIPSEPNLAVGDVVGGAGFIKVTWDGNNALAAAASNFDRVNVHISGTTFGDGTKPAGFFKQSGTQTFAAVAGVYIVQLKILTVNGSESLYSTARTVTVTSAAPAAESSVTPSTPTVSSVLGAIQLSWNGKTSSGGDQPFGFNAAKVYVGTSAGFTPSSSNQVDVLNFANGQNTLNIGVGTIVNGVALDYGIDYYIKIATTNGTDTSTAVSATGNPVRVGQVTSGDIVTVTADKIATGTLSAGSTITVGSTAGKHIKLSGTGDPFIIYGSGGVSNPVLSYNGTKLTVVGDGTFSGALSAATGTFAGSLSAATGSFSGTITASGGSIGGITIAADGIQNSGGTFKLDSSGTARFGSASTNAIIISPTLGIYHSLNGGTSANGYFTFGPSSSTISGWTISTNQISKGSTILDASSTDGFIQIGSGSSFFKTSSTGIQLGNETFGSAPFRVTAAGALTATNADITGAITATSGSFTGSIYASAGNIGGWSILANGRLADSGSTTIFIPDTVSNTYGLISTRRILTNGLSTDGGTSLDLNISGGIAVGGANFVVSTLGALTASASLTTGGALSVGTTASVGGSVTFGTGSNAFYYLGSSGIIRVPSVYGNAVTSSRTLLINSSGDFGTSLSTRRRKHNIEDYSINEENFLQLELKKFNYLESIDPYQNQEYGFIAEEAEALGLLELIQFDKEGIPDYFDYSRLPIFLHQLIKTQKAQIDLLKTRLDALER